MACLLVESMESMESNGAIVDTSAESHIFDDQFLFGIPPIQASKANNGC